MKSLVLIALSFFLFPAFAQEDGEKLSPAEQLLEVMQFEKTIVESGDAGFPAVEQSLAGQGLTKEEMTEVKEAFKAYILRLASDPVLKSKTIKLYESKFSNEEILEMIEFYKTPLGQKSLHALPQITAEATQFSMELAQKHVGPFQDALTGILARKAEKEENKDDE